VFILNLGDNTVFGVFRLELIGMLMMLSFITLWTVVFQTKMLSFLTKSIKFTPLRNAIVTNIFTFSSYFILDRITHNLQLNYDVSHALELSKTAFFVILMAMIHMLIFFAAIVKSNKSLPAIKKKPFKKLGAWFITTLIFSLSATLFISWQVGFIVGLFSLIFLITLDFFLDQEIKTLSYYIWMILIGSTFISYIAYQPSKKFLTNKAIGEVKKEFYILNKNDENSINAFIDSLVSSGKIRQIFSSDQIDLLNRNDLIDYLSDGLPDGYLLSDVILKKQGVFITNFGGKTKDGNTTRLDLFKYGLSWSPTKPHFSYAYNDSLGQELRLDIILKSKERPPSHPYRIIKVQDDQTRIVQSIEGFRTYDIPINNDLRSDIYLKEKGYIGPVSLFAIIFAISILLFFAAVIFNDKLKIFKEDNFFKISDRSSLSFRIQLTIVGLSMFSFLVIGIITSLYIRKLAREEDFLKARESVAMLQNYLQEELRYAAESQAMENYLITRRENLSSLFNGSIESYDRFGNPLGGKVSNKINPSSKDPNLIRLYNARGELAIYVKFTHNTLDQTGTTSSSYVYNYIGTILNVYIFLFLLATAIAIAISNSVTNPLQILRENLLKFKLGKNNAKLSWNRNDEIGDLISDYNKLTDEISKSAEIIARTEREMAWREMAKQVAHEIKNPLTPMKLSLQYLDRAAASDPEIAKQMITKINSTLMEQINNLTQIADSFSNFATLPKTSNEKVVINEIVEAIHDLFRKREDIVFNMIEPMNDLYVFADRNHLIRILNNIVKNAIQAIPEDKIGKIDIELKAIDGKALIRVSDNGIGISEPMKAKVFTPNFTTKSSGTGLGLAISANMLESMNGRIYFESELGIGTNFFIELPLIKGEDDIVSEDQLVLDED
jgi:signal transduction histidine kinase